MMGLELKERARDVVWVGRVALAVVLVPLTVPLVLIGSAAHVLTEWLDRTGHEITPSSGTSP